MTRHGQASDERVASPGEWRHPSGPGFREPGSADSTAGAAGPLEPRWSARRSLIVVVALSLLLWSLILGATGVLPIRF
ncbi:hypothetical protein H7F50_17725 [Novosphingobium flavum]|uniref:Uncharacterized protein n=1 Tax=Novosphingobium aerophilum TaxID=2839843 RepID=A0A7X1F9H3_9SPHN|nr:hypothetical protein [Novosphingobium aerophilum]MBC2652858.1 hypothetical protein [Novosphingobium aerophilum]MBC2663583.1 hypothetical protein [Novosphingobium aerophilum]